MIYRSYLKMASSDNIDRKLEDLNLSQDEVDRFTQALQKPEFKELFFEYAQEISDPKNRELYENEIRQMESERGMDIKFVNPHPGYVIKTTIDGEKKAFINVCTNDLIGKPSSRKQVGQDGRAGLSWSLPHSFTPPRDDLAKKGERCTIFDFVIHPDTYRMAETNDRFKKMINDTALDGIKNMFNVEVDRKNLKFPKIKYKGSVTPAVIRTKLPHEPDAVERDSDDMKNDFPYPYDTKTSEEKSNEILAKNTKEQNAKKESKTKITKKSEAVEDDEFTVPKYLIKYQSNFDIQDFAVGPNIKSSSNRPNKLIIEIDLPLLNSAEPVSLDVFEKRLLLVSHKPAKYKLDLALSYSVDENEGSAKFDKNRRKLVVTLPVVWDKSKSNEDEETHQTVNDLSGNQSKNGNLGEIGNEEREPVETAKPLIEVISQTDSNDLEDELNENFETEKKESEAIVLVNSLHPDDVTYLLPEFECKEDPKQIQFHFAPKNIKKDSIMSSVLSHNLVSVKMTSIGHGGFPVHYSCLIKFEDDCCIDADRCKIDLVEKKARLVITKDERSICFWKTYSVGTDLLHLEMRNCSLNGVDFMDDIIEKDDNQIDSDDDDKPNQESETAEDESAENIVVLHEKEPPSNLHGILKQQTVSESSDDELEECHQHPHPHHLRSVMKKSVSFNDEIDESESVSQSHETTKTKNKRQESKVENGYKIQQEKKCSVQMVSEDENVHLEDEDGHLKMSATGQELSLMSEELKDVEMTIDSDLKVEVFREKTSENDGSNEEISREDSKIERKVEERSLTVQENEGIDENRGQTENKSDKVMTHDDVILIPHAHSNDDETQKEELKNLLLSQSDDDNKDNNHDDDDDDDDDNNAVETSTVSKEIKHDNNFTSASIPLVSDKTSQATTSVDQEPKMKWISEFKNKLVFDLDVD